MSLTDCEFVSNSKFSILYDQYDRNNKDFDAFLDRDFNLATNYNDLTNLYFWAVNLKLKNVQILNAFN